jgi:hypothetical protein
VDPARGDRRGGAAGEAEAAPAHARREPRR